MSQPLCPLELRAISRSPLARLYILAQQPQRETGTGADRYRDREIADHCQNHGHEEQRAITRRAISCARANAPGSLISHAVTMSSPASAGIVR